MANYRFTIKFRGDKIDIIQECESEDGKVEPFIEVDSELKFSFVIQLKNKQIFSFTDLPFIQMGKEAFFFSNKVGAKTIPDGKLSKKDFVGEDEKQLLFPKSSKELELLDWEKEKVLSNISQNIQYKIESLEELAYTLQKAEDGFYTINTGKKTELSFILFKEKYSTTDFGLIEFYLAPPKPIVYEQAIQHTIDFDTRKLPWQYQVFERFNSIKNISVVDDQAQIKFKEQGSAEVNGLQSKLFVSEQAIPVKEVNKQVFKVISNGKGKTQKTWLEKLPTPKLSNIAKESKSSKNLVFKEYVYL